MNIETKWNLDQRCYFINDEGAIRTGIVSEIIVNIKKHSDIPYMVETIIVTGVTDNLNTKTASTRALADKFFPDKESAGLAWLKLNGLNCGLSKQE
jgi:hypothetical protein